MAFLPVIALEAFQDTWQSSTSNGTMQETQPGVCRVPASRRMGRRAYAVMCNPSQPACFVRPRTRDRISHSLRCRSSAVSNLTRRKAMPQAIAITPSTK